MKKHMGKNNRAKRPASSGIRLKKELGQFILKDRSITERIASVVPIGHLIVEIGPGDGALTEQLLNHGHHLIGVELDQEMVRKLEQRFNHRRDFRLISGNILKVDWNKLAGKSDDIIIVGNLPYHLFSPILFNIFEIVRQNRIRISEMIVMLQHEVGRRLTAEPRNKDFGSLTLLTRYHGIPHYLFTVPADCFHPKPRVDGAVVRIIFHQPDEMPDVDYETFRRVVRGCFAQRRKMMRNAMTVIEDLPEGWQNLGYDFKLRPEQLNFKEFVNLTKDLIKLQQEMK